MESSELPKMVTEPYEGECRIHGNFTSEQIMIADRWMKKGCPGCAIDRKAKQDEADALEASRKAQEAEKRTTERRRAAGVPVRYDAKTLESYRVTNDGQKKALAACQRLVEAIRENAEAPNLIMTGKPGTGKSHLSCGIVLDLYKSHRVCRIDLPDLIREIRATWRRDSEESEEKVLDWYGSISLLILEEVGTGAGSDDERARIFQVINRRYEAVLPTVIVTNLEMAELTKEMGERVIDRLREGDRSLVIFDWASERGAK